MPHFPQHTLDGSAFKGTKRGEIPIPFLYMPFNLDWPASYEKWGKKGYATEYRRIMREFIAHFEEKGWDRTVFEIIYNHKKRYRLYPFDGDETRFVEDEALIDRLDEIFGNILDETHIKLIPRTDSSWRYRQHYQSEYMDFFKMWVAWSLGLSWEPESARIMKEKGNILFIYGGMSPMDESMLSLYMWIVKCAVRGIKGFTFWNAFDLSGDPLQTPAQNGGVTIFYPGTRFGYDLPLPSIRLKALRNFMQLTELHMAAEGGYAKERLDQMVHRHLGIDESFWLLEKPSFYDNPPHTWTNTNFSEVKPGVEHAGKSPVIVENIKNDLLAFWER